MTQRRFPIINAGNVSGCMIFVPWDLLGPHENQAQKNHGQSLERLAERGGLAPSEALAVLEDRSWHEMNLRSAIEILDAKWQAWSVGQSRGNERQMPKERETA